MQLRAAVRSKLVLWAPLLILITWTLLPLVWLVTASFRPPLEVYLNPSVFPKELTLESYRGVISYPGFFRYLYNSAVLAILSTIGAVIVSSMAAYSFARHRFPWRHVLLMAILVPRILPRAALIVPLYQLFVNLGLLNTYTVLVVTYIASAVPLSTWILTGFFQGVPKELEESAKIDGAGFWRRLWSIILPLALPGVMSVSIISVVMSWNEFPFVLAFTTSSTLRTLPYQLFLVRDTMGVQDWPLLNAFTISTIVPILLLYMRFEKNIVRGLLSGATK